LCEFLRKVDLGRLTHSVTNTIQEFYSKSCHRLSTNYYQQGNLTPTPLIVDNVRGRDYIGVLPMKMLLEETNLAFIRPLPDQIDFSDIKKWLHKCLESHSSCSFPGSLHLDLDLTLINCDRCVLVNLSDLSSTHGRHEYVTLSYLWGSGIGNQGLDGKNLPRDLPKVIEDSIAVVTALGFRYLWVDRYCIPQDDMAEKQIQLRNMGDIYSHSVLTIIAAAGEDSSFGLPGVNNTKRAEKSIIRIRDYALLQSLPSLRDSIMRSDWDTRGWTFQEGLLARRRLIFTPHQVFFECSKMSCVESVHPNPVNLDPIFNELVANKTVYSSRRQLMALIDNFSQRQFTFPADAFNAFKGVLDKLGEDPDALQHILGVPIFIGQMNKGRSDTKISESRKLSKNFGFALGLSWHTPTLSNYLKRRKMVPSWTWLGWDFTRINDIAFYFFDDSIHSKTTIDERMGIPKIAVDFDDSTCFMIEDDLEKIHAMVNKGMTLRNLRLRAWTVHLTPVIQTRLSSWGVQFKSGTTWNDKKDNSQLERYTEVEYSIGKHHITSKFVPKHQLTKRKLDESSESYLYPDNEFMGLWLLTPMTGNEILLILTRPDGSRKDDAWERIEITEINSDFDEDFDWSGQSNTDAFQRRWQIKVQMRYSEVLIK
jgi:hypothetical protein